MIVKAHLGRMNASGAKAAALHVRYIERDGVEKDGTKGVLYGPDGPVRAEVFEQPRPHEKHQFRLIVSPEDADQLDLKEFVRRYMARVENDLGRKLEWAAVNHHDTDHPHAHIIVRGVDRDGAEVRLDRGYISNGLRWRAQEIATEELGPRREVDLQRARTKEVTQERFTALDKELERRAVDNRVVIRAGKTPGALDESTVVARLEHLARLRLATRLSTTTWSLADGWQEQLRELGSRGDVLKQIHAAISGDPCRYRILRAGEALQPTSSDGQNVLSGRIARKGLSDELKGSFYAVIETPQGAAYHVPLDARAADALRPGDIVSFTTKPEPPVREVDKQIADSARARGGSYVLKDPSPTPGAGAQPHARRLRELEKLGLAVPEDQGRWKVAPDLLEQLERRHQAGGAKHRLLLHKEPRDIAAQVRHPGPVWLDRLTPAGFAPYGLGAELRRAVEQRRSALRHLGIDPDAPDRTAKLRELERQAVGKDIARRLGQTFVPVAPSAFRGRVQIGAAGTSEAAYAIVSDGGRFVLLKATASLRVADGKTVSTSRDAKGRVVVRRDVDRGL